MSRILHRGSLTLLALALSLMGGRQAAAQDVFVPTDYPTIEQALAAASAGWQVHVEAGDYYETGLVVPDGVSLIGAGAAWTAIRSPDPDGVVIHAGESVVGGLSIIGGQVGILAEGIQSSLYIAEIYFEGLDYGIAAQNIQPNQVPQLTIYNNAFENTANAVALELFSSVTLLFSENIIYCQANGLVMQMTTNEYDSNLTINNNIIWGCNDTAIELAFIDGNTPSPAVDLYHNVFASNNTAFRTTCNTQGMGWVASLNNILLNNSIAMTHTYGYNQDCLPYSVNNHAGVSNPGAYQGYAPGTDEWTDSSPFTAYNPNAGSYLDNDFTLAVGSPFIDNGDSQAMGDDWDGSLCDIGAYGGSDAMYMDYDVDMDYYYNDCDDHDPWRSSYYPEMCDGLDNDCDGMLPPDEQDNDGDGWSSCMGDCNDTSPEVHPYADESECDHMDSNCDGEMHPHEIDDDGDGSDECEGDCDDSNDTICPDCPEMICDDIDNDCNEDTKDRPDDDGDGYGACEDDCDDNDPGVHPDRDEKCDNGVDDNCDGLTDGEDVESCPDGDDDDDDDNGADDDDSGPPAGFACRCSVPGGQPVSGALAWLALALMAALRVRHRIAR